LYLTVSIIDCGRIVQRRSVAVSEMFSQTNVVLRVYFMYTERKLLNSWPRLL